MGLLDDRTPAQPKDTLSRLTREAENKLTRIAAEGATPPVAPTERKTPFSIAVDYLSRPMRAVAGGLKAGFDYRERNPYQTTADRFKLDLGQFKAAGEGFSKGLRGETDFTVADPFITPDFARNNPKTTIGLRLGGAILGDPLTYGGGALVKLAGGAFGKAALTSLAGAPDVAANIERTASLAAPALRGLKPVAAVESTLRNVSRVFQKGGGRPEFAEDLRRFRATKDMKRQDIIDEVKAIVDPLSPEQRVEVRRMLDLPGGQQPSITPAKPVSSPASVDPAELYSQQYDEAVERVRRGVEGETPDVTERFWLQEPYARDNVVGRVRSTGDDIVQNLSERQRLLNLEGVKRQAVPLFEGRPDIQAVLRGEATSADLASDVAREIPTTPPTSQYRDAVQGALYSARNVNTLQTAAEREVDQLTRRLAQGLTSTEGKAWARERALELLREDTDSALMQWERAQQSGVQRVPLSEPPLPGSTGTTAFNVGNRLTDTQLTTLNEIERLSNGQIAMREGKLVFTPDAPPAVTAQARNTNLGEDPRWDAMKKQLGVTYEEVPPAPLSPVAESIPPVPAANVAQVAETPVERAARLARANILDWVPEQYAAEGIPLNTIDEGYFPRVRQRDNALDMLKGFFRRRPVKTSDPFTQARKLMRDKPIEAVNKEIGREFFREDLGVPLAVRKVAAMENIEGRRFLRGMLDRYGLSPQQIAEREGLSLSSDELANLKPSYASLPDGYVWVSPDSGAIVKNQDAPNVGAVALPGDIARTIDGLSGAWRNPDDAMRQIETAANALRRFWAASVTVYRPGFHFQNWTGGAINNFLAGVRNPARYKQSYDVLEGKAGQFVTDAGKRISYEDMRTALRQTGTLNSGFAGSLEDNFLSSTERALGEKINPLKRPGAAYGEKARQLGRAVENHVRSTLFIDSVLKGDSYDDAARKVIEFHFDYSPEGLDPVGRALKPWVPFYVWLRNNLALQFTQFVKQPQTYVNYDRIRTALAGDAEERPDYLRKAIPLGSKGGREILLNLRTPIEDVTTFTENPARALLSSIDPRAKVPMDFAYNQNTFTGAPIRRFEGETTPFLGMDIDPGLAYLVRGLSGLPGTLEQVGSEAIEQGGMGVKQYTKLGAQILPGLSSYDPAQQKVSEAYARNKQLDDALRALAQRLGRQVITIPELRGPNVGVKKGLLD